MDETPHMESEEQTSPAQTSPAKKEKRSRILKWSGANIGLLAGILFSFFYLYYVNQNDYFVIALIFGLIISVGVATAFVWRLTAQNFTPMFIGFAESKIDNNPGNYCLVRSPQSAPSTKMDHLQMALEWCLFPTLMVFFVLSYASDAITGKNERIMQTSSDGGTWWAIYIIMFIIPPIFTFIVPPMRIIDDSSLMTYDVQKRILEPYGARFKRMFRSIGGVGALATFLKVALAQGGIEAALEDTITILLFTLPTIFIATIVYGIWHTDYVRTANEAIDRFRLRWYAFAHIDSVNHEIRLELIKGPLDEEENGDELCVKEDAGECVDETDSSPGAAEQQQPQQMQQPDGTAEPRDDFAPPMGFARPVPPPEEKMEPGETDTIFHGEKSELFVTSDFAPPVAPSGPDSTDMLADKRLKEEEETNEKDSIGEEESEEEEEDGTDEEEEDDDAVEEEEEEDDDAVEEEEEEDDDIDEEEEDDDTDEEKEDGGTDEEKEDGGTDEEDDKDVEKEQSEKTVKKEDEGFFARYMAGKLDLGTDEDSDTGKDESGNASPGDGPDEEEEDDGKGGETV